MCGGWPERSVSLVPALDAGEGAEMPRTCDRTDRVTVLDPYFYH